MDNPLDRPRRPDNYLRDAEDFARDLAFGALQSDWEPFIDVTRKGHWLAPFHITPTANNRLNQNKFVTKWLVDDVPKHPSFALLTALDYLVIMKDHRANVTGGQVEISYKLTTTCFDLLKTPAESPFIFISYRRSESSALALLIEARLRLAGADPDRIFIDRNIPGGTDWETLLRNKVQNCDYFVSLIAPTTFDSIYVQQEFDWAYEEGCAIIPVCHNGFTLGQCDDRIQKYHGFDIDEEQPSAMKYESAVNFVLNSIGYRTY